MKTLIACLVIAIPLVVFADDTPGDAQTVEFLRKLQTPGGGFLAREPAENIRLAPTLKATSAAIRALGNVGGKPADADSAKKFVARCFDAASGGFADMPGGKADVATTAIGLMAVRALDMPTEPYADAAVKYLSDNAKSFEDIRIAVAGLEAIERKAPKAEAWLADIKMLRKADGTFGAGLSQARETGGAVVILLRLGDTVEGRDAILAALREGQRPSGGFGKADSELDADLETSYRVMRCFWMMKDQPKRIEALRTYVAKCRNEGGGYAVEPGETSTVSGTYYATTIRKWLK